MLDIAPEKVGHIIIRARELDSKVDAWDTAEDDADAATILENRGDDATEAELREFIKGLNVDEQASLVAVMWVGRGTYEADEIEEAKQVAAAEATNPTEDYLLGIPLLADFLEEGLSRLGIEIDDAEAGF